MAWALLGITTNVTWGLIWLGITAVGVAVSFAAYFAYEGRRRPID